MIKHTPGPWTTHKHLNGKLVIAAHNDGSPALALAYIPTDIGRPEDERAANAQLMAAAPELLAVVGNLLAFARDSYDDNGPGDTISVNNAFFTQLAKARDSAVGTSGN